MCLFVKLSTFFSLPVIEGLVSEGVSGAPEPRVGVAVLVLVVDGGGCVAPLLLLLRESLPLAVDVLDGRDGHLGPRGAAGGVVE